MSDKSRSLLKDANLRMVFSTTLVAVMGVPTIAPAFPEIIDHFQIEPAQVSWLITIFMIPGVLLAPIFGLLADRFGRKLIIAPSLFLFGIAGIACFFADNFSILLLLRFIQGIGGAALGSLNATIIGDLYKGQALTKAMGYTQSVLSVGTTSYPAVGGALALLGWNYPFLLSGLGIPVGLAVLFILKSPEPKNKQKLGEYFDNILRLVKEKNVYGVFVASIVIFIILYGIFLNFYPIFIENTFHESPLVIGLVMSSMSISAAVSATQISRLSSRLTKQQIICLIFLLFSVTLLSLTFIGSIYMLLLPTILIGSLIGIGIPTIMTLLTETAPIQHRAGIMAINGTLIRFGQAAGPVMISVAFSFYGLLAPFYMGAILALITAIFFYILFFDL